MKRLLVLSPLVLVASVAAGAGIMLLASLPFMETSIFVNEDTEGEFRRLFVSGGALLGGLCGLLIVGGLWANALFGWEPSWDRSPKRRQR